MTPTLPELLSVATTAARAAGALQLERRRAGIHVEEKGAADITTDVDRACEDCVVGLVRERFPSHAVLAEEGTDAKGASGFLWIIDPLDGTKNYAHGYARSCVSIAVARDGQVVVGVVYNPAADELFAASLGDGASMNGAAIHVSQTPKLSRAMVASALAYDPTPGVRRADRAQLERLARVLAAAEAVRSDGCCALDLCDVARGRFDAYFEQGLKAWDTAAGALIVREAGGTVCTFTGAPHDIYGLDTLASNGRIQAELVALMA